MKQDKSRDWWYEPIVVDLETSFFETMQTFVCTGVHHIYVIDSQSKLVGEINHRDLLRQLLIFALL